MSSGIEYALGALLFFGIDDLVYKRGAAAGAQPHHLLMVQSWGFLPAGAFYGLFTRSLTVVARALLGPLGGLFMAVRFFQFAHNPKSRPNSVNSPVFPLRFV